jgi:hypothetical protein
MAEAEPKSEGEVSDGGSAKKNGAPWWLEIIKVAAMPLVTLIVGFVINSSLDTRQARENNVRLYADMMGRREESDSALRKDMFKSILDTFMQKDPEMKADQYLDQQVLDIELLAYNFHESLDLGPLFKHVRHLIPNDQTGPNADKRARLEKVAREVNERQLTVLSDSGAVVRGSAELNHVQSATAYLSFSGPYTVTGKSGRAPESVPRLCMQLNPEGTEQHYRQFRMEVIDYDPKTREVQARLYASRPLSVADCERLDLDLVGNREVDTTFWVGLFAFPMIDNTRLSHGERCAVSVTGLTPDIVELALSYFPGSRASLKDKPYYDELMHDLLRKETPSAHREP